MAFVPLANLQPEPELRPVGALAERRQHLRMPLRGLTLYAEDGRAYAGRGDLSVGGARWTGDGQPPVGARVELGLALPGLSQEVRLQASVCQVQRGEGVTGVCASFFALPADVRETIARCVDDWFHIADASGLLSP
ncbi:MAG: PilZ domain-containing protein [Myxococcaceae bacterium]|nr:PilZ domain-containing protein [Myxococcaceae bacterium]